MGVFADVLAQKKTFQSPRSQTAAFLQSLLNRQADPAVTAAAAVNAVHTLAVDTVDHTGGTFTLAFGIRNPTTGALTTFTTAAIAYNAAAATIEGAIDTAATAASVPDWTNGDITVAGGNLQSATPVTLTYDGASVAGGNHSTVVFADSMTGGTSPATRVTLTTAGQTARAAWGVLVALGVVSGTLPTQRAAASTTGFTVGPNKKVPGWFIRAMAAEASAEDANQGTYFTIVETLGMDDRAPIMEPTVTSDHV